MNELRPPLLAATMKEINLLKFPMLASPKLDGVRCLIHDGVAYSRSLKPLPNAALQTLVKSAQQLNGLDGELIMGDPTAPNAFRKTMSKVMSDDEPIEGLTFWVFDVYDVDLTFERRYRALGSIKHRLVKVVPHVLVKTAAELEQLEKLYLGQGYEGVMLRDVYGRYKHGRSTAREGILLKLKRFCDSEAVVLRINELQINVNEQTTSPTGHKVRSSKKEGKVTAATMGSLTVRDLKTGVEFDLGTGFNEQDRMDWWRYGIGYKGGVVKYKYFPTGSKDKPRFPVYLGVRDRRDL
jgi:DNA ligase-1